MLQRRLASKNKGSNNYEKARKKVEKQHNHIAFKRKDYHLKLAHKVCDMADSIFLEDIDLRQGFPPISPDFVIELVSPSDLKNQRYEDLQAKMQEYLDNGVKLGWLIEPSAKTVEIYRLEQPVEILNNPQTLSGEAILPGFVWDLGEIF